MNHIMLSNDDVDIMTNQIALEIRSGGEPYTHILGVSRGGLNPAVRLSHIFDLPLAITNYSSPDGNGHGSEKFFWQDDRHVPIDRGSRVLVVDDIADTGSTLRDIGEELKVHCDLVRFAVLIYRHGSAIYPHYIGREISSNDPWVRFPWEN